MRIAQTALRKPQACAPTDRLFPGLRPGPGTGQRWDASIGLYDYNARYYDPALGRFISADTIVPNPANPQSLNRYAYVLNNPLRYVDPSGHWTCEGMEGCTDYIQWILDTMSAAGTVGADLVDEFLSYDASIKGGVRIKFDAPNTCIAGKKVINFNRGRLFAKEDTISHFAHEVSHLVDQLGHSIQGEVVAYQKQYQIAEEYMSYVGMSEQEKFEYRSESVATQWLYFSEVKVEQGRQIWVPSDKFLNLDPNNIDDLELAREMIVTWAPDSAYGNPAEYPLRPVSNLRWNLNRLWYKITELW